jgi:signal peptidase I
MKKTKQEFTGRQNPPGEGADETKPTQRGKNRRESIESFVVVFVAFLVFSLEAEGFVIPTGSMAPTLMGRHKEIVCPECGDVYTVNADCEVDSDGTGAATGIRVAWGTCQNCRFTSRVDDAPSVSGDRIYTMKKNLALPLLPQAGRVGPARWEVAVFRLPEDPQVRYIKRLVGMPDEIIRIQQGDIWRRPSHGSEPFQRLRRPISHQMAMQVLVYDDSHRAASLRANPEWRRWVPEPEGWTEPDPGTYAGHASGQGWSELRYRHVVPDPEQWEDIRAGRPLSVPPRPMLVTDFSSYNTDLSPQGWLDRRSAARPWFQPHWVGDLTLSCRVDVRQTAGRLRLDLIKAGESNRCELDLSTGQATLTHGQRRAGPPVHTTINTKGVHLVTFANVDDRLTLIVDGILPFGDGRPCEPESSWIHAIPTAADLEPARIAVQGADLEVTRLVLKRDIYYTLQPGESDQLSLEDFSQVGPRGFFDMLADPARYAGLGPPPRRDYPLGPGRYLMLGDNSPWSRDGRAWGRRDQIDQDDPPSGWDDSGRESWEVPESLIIGKAFCVYWPHLKPAWPEFRLGPDQRFPVRPNIERIRWIR